MKIIKKYVEHIEEEIEGAKEYAERYVEYKAKGDMQTASKFKAMAEDELHHASIIHEQAVKEIDQLSKVITPPAEMMEKWQHEHAEYVENAAWVRQMLAL